MRPTRVVGDRGSVSVEFAVLAPVVLVVSVALTVYGGRWVRAGNEVRSAAHAGARAASLAPDAASARDTAVGVVAANLVSAGVACSGGPVVAVEVSAFGPGGQVTVTVSCEADLADVAVLGVAGRVTVTGSATEVIDRYIGGT